MRLNRKLVFALGNVAGAVVVGLVVVACGGGGGNGGSGSAGFMPPTGGSSNPGTEAGSSPGTIKASNVILRSGLRVAGSVGKPDVIRVQVNELPDNVQVIASNVVLTTASNGLSSTDLQSALDKEIAVNVSKSIVGTWDVENYPATSWCHGSSGRVQLNADGTATMISGGFFALGSFSPDGNANPSCRYTYQSHTYRIIADGAAVAVEHSKYSDPQFPNAEATQTVALILRPTVDSMTFTSGNVVSTLKRVGPTPTVSAPPAAPKGTVVAMNEN
ncbi:hypothetical protein [Variovorax sp. DT-64]|uniref:hypothetical protein n=1 Tax=Variovorax sp. DT-64 TaxID=3396160 RepID=UPI003F1A399F